MKVLPTTRLGFINTKGFNEVSRNDWNRLSGALLKIQWHFETSEYVGEEIAIRQEGLLFKLAMRYMW